MLADARWELWHVLATPEVIVIHRSPDEQTYHLRAFAFNVRWQQVESLSSARR